MVYLPVYLIIAIGLSVAIILTLILQFIINLRKGDKKKYPKYRKPRAVSSKSLYFPYGLHTSISARRSSEPDRYETYFDYADTANYQNKGQIYSQSSEQYIKSSKVFASTVSLKAKMLRYQEILLGEIVSEEKLQSINDELFHKFADTQPWLIEKIPYRPGLMFNFHPDNPLSNIVGSLLTFTQERDLLYIGFLEKRFPFTFDLQGINEEKRKYVKDTVFTNIIGKNHILQSSVPAGCLEIFKDNDIRTMLSNLLPTIKRLFIDDEAIFAILNDNICIIDLIKIINLMYQKTLSIEKYGSKTTLLRCYECGDLFDATEMNCDKCEASRPTCVVCLLNLNPLEKEGIMRLPCCGVYAHIHHIELWLEKNTKCPNCHQDLNRIFRKIQ